MRDKQAKRRRPSYLPNTQHVEHLQAQSGLSIVDFASHCGIGEKTLRKILHGDRVDAATLRTVAENLNLNTWHELLADDERIRLAVLPMSTEDQPGRSQTVSETPPGTPKRLCQLPAEVADFTGRESEIQRMAERLRAGGRGVEVSAVRGMGGVGKTSLAVKFAHQVRDHYPDAQLFLDLRGLSEQPMTSVEAMTRIISDLRPDMPDLPEAEEKLLPLYRIVLAGKRVLILLDNAKDEAQVKYLVTVSPPASFIVTSRSALALDGVESIRLDVLSMDEALVLLRGIVGANGSDAELRTIAELCGQLPLALRVAGDFLRLKEDWSTAQYIAALHVERLRWLKVGNTPEKDVEAVLKLSSAQLVRDNLDLAERWHLLHLFPADFDVPAVAAVWAAASDGWDVHSDLSTLVNRSLILFDGAMKRYRLHDLMRPIAKTLFG